MKKTIFAFASFFPLFASAEISDTIVQVSGIVEQLVSLLMALAILVFFWGIVKFIANMDDEDSRKGGKHLMIWGMIAIFVMVSFWSIIGYVQESLGLVGGPIITGEAPSVTNSVPSYNP